MEIRGFSAISVLVVITVISRAKCFSPGYSFAKFMGPVSGAVQKITYDDGQYHQHDYDAKPDYHFEYGVEDPKSKVHQSRQEAREGDTVHGEYSVLDPDGKLRTVKYTADKKNGFQATISTDGHVVRYPQDPVKPIYDQYTPHAPPQVPTYHGGNGGGTGGGGDDGGDYDGDEGGDGDEYSDDGGSDGDDEDGEEEEEYY